MGKMIKIGMAELNICMPPDAITTLGLGSCVGVVLYDPVKKISGMVQGLRIYLPMQGTWVQSLVGKLRSHMPPGN